MSIDVIQGLAERVRTAVGTVILGQDDAVDQLLVALLCQGHVLVEGVPGLGKTLLARTLAQTLDLSFQRVQFTPDLMPADVTGQLVYDMKHGEFRLRKGPVFTHVLLADEINRTPPKTQSALLEAMEERQVTIDGEPHPLPEPFLVVATQNPVEHEGTYPLPEAQLDRFFLKIVMEYPDPQAELELLRRAQAGPDAFRVRLEPVAGGDALMAARAALSTLTASDAVLAYVNDIGQATRRSPHLQLGASPRALIALLQAARAAAALAGRDFVTPDDVKDMCLPVLRHRVVLQPEAEVTGLSADDALAAVLQTVPVPR